MNTILLHAALQAAERGWHVFPLRPGSKRPALHGEQSCPRTGPCSNGHRKWEQRAEEADEDFRDTRKKLRAEADKYLELIEQSLQGTQETEHLFTIRWRITT